MPKELPNELKIIKADQLPAMSQIELGKHLYANERQTEEGKIAPNSQLNNVMIGAAADLGLHGSFLAYEHLGAKMASKKAIAFAKQGTNVLEVGQEAAETFKDGLGKAKLGVMLGAFIVGIGVERYLNYRDETKAKLQAQTNVQSIEAEIAARNGEGGVSAADAERLEAAMQGGVHGKFTAKRMAERGQEQAAGHAL